MRRVWFTARSIILGASMSALVSNATHAEPSAAQPNKVDPARHPLSLASYNTQDPATMERTTVRTTESSDNHWEIDGPVFLRSADPEPPGEVVFKNNFEWEHNRSGGGDDRDEYEYEPEIEWGVVENHELIFEVPFKIGEGEVDGNGDLTVGWHWRLWDEEGSRPAFAIRNFVRIPTGVNSNGVDYELRGLFTKTLVPGSTRLHLNPFAKTVNGDNEPENRPFHWGTAIGVDHKLSNNLLLITDYIYSNGEEENTRDNHEAEVGLDWHLDERQTLGFAVMAGLDGDDFGPAVGARFMYMISLGR